MIDLIGFSLVALIVLFIYLKRRTSDRVRPESWLPPELVNAKLLGVEVDLVLRETFNINGRADRLYQLPDGQIVPVERKNRNSGRVFATDRFQLSLYAYILQQNGRPAAPFGFVVFPGDTPAQKVSLLSNTDVEKKLVRYQQLRSGAVSSNKNIGPKCKTCSHAHRCHT